MMELDNNYRLHRPVQRVLRRKHSQEYFTGTGWTNNLEEARSFQDCLEAAQTCAQCGLSGVEMVLRVEDGTSDLYCTEVR